jgi:hydrogenase-4 component F
MHTWKPDTYSEAPNVVGALMAGALTSCAFLGVARITQVAAAAGIESFTRPLLLGFGVLSVAVAAAFMIGQRDIKRLLAYSSVEHMGLLVLGLGLGGLGAYGATLHVVTNGLTKGLLFLVAGNLLLIAGTGTPHGLIHRLPISGPLLLLGLFAITGSPPFGVFLSEVTILRAAFAGGHFWIAGILLVLLALIFLGIAGTVLEMLLGKPDEKSGARDRESGWLVVGPLALTGAVLLLGIYIPGPLQRALQSAAGALGGAGAP